MTTTRQLLDGLGGAMGSHYVATTNQLYFVEVDGKVPLDTTNLVHSLDTVVFSGTAVVAPDSSPSLADGTSEGGGDIRWDHESPGGQLSCAARAAVGWATWAWSTCPTPSGRRQPLSPRR